MVCKTAHEVTETRERLLKQENSIEKVRAIESVLLFSINYDVEHPIISICIPTYKRIEARRAVLSSINQIGTDVNYEVIVIDNNCDFSDNSLKDWFNTLSVARNCRVMYYKNKENLGMFGNWNKCFELANADWIGMLHDDDTVDNDYLMRMVSILSKHSKDNLGYIRTSSFNVREGDDTIRWTIKNRIKKSFGLKLRRITKIDCLIHGNAGMIGAPSCGSIINKNAILKMGGYNQSFYPTSDCYPPYMMLSEYSVYITMAPFGKRYFGENESCKYETLRGWAKEYTYFQKYMSTESPLFKKFLQFFGDQQYYSFINGHIKTMGRLGGITVTDKDFEDIHIAHNSHLKSALLKTLRVLWNVYTQSKSLLFR